MQNFSTEHLHGILHPHSPPVSPSRCCSLQSLDSSSASEVVVRTLTSSAHSAPEGDTSVRWPVALISSNPQVCKRLARSDRVLSPSLSVAREVLTMTAIFLCCKLECTDCSSQLVLRFVKQLSENTSQIARRLHNATILLQRDYRSIYILCRQGLKLLNFKEC